MAGRKVVIAVTGPAGTARFTLRLFTPAGREVRGTFLLIDHRSAVDDTGSTSDYAPISQIVGAGYALAALDAGEVAPDDPGRFRDGVIGAFHHPDAELPDNAGRTIAAWAWAASRALDYLHTDDATAVGVDPGRVAVIGHSRGGKAALWAGAQDTRFPVVVSNNSGAGGAKPADTGRGESLDALTSRSRTGSHRSTAPTPTGPTPCPSTRTSSSRSSRRAGWSSRAPLTTRRPTRRANTPPTPPPSARGRSTSSPAPGSRTRRGHQRPTGRIAGRHVLPPTHR
ncbi:S9 family peptidase [Pseudonocardia sp. ICBG601]|uniref:alpha/beta hydrolase family protein n=1 Tax=Pseudonocardia sp. ICBG601 TaxID=2846759 RepID=UPI001CF6C594|nr:hypothetical protein [Pseudonocardia sp. ICBG601]